MASFEIEALVRGYHIYKDVWSAVVEEFPCKREDGKRFDPFTVAVCNGDIEIYRTRSKKDFICLFAIYSSRWQDQLPCDRL